MLHTKSEITDADSRAAPSGRLSGVNQSHAQRRFPIGAELIGENEIHFRLWAPKAKSVDVVLETPAGKSGEPLSHSLDREEGGYFSGAMKAGAGALYRFRLDGADSYPDPASRYQPDGPHGPSCIVDPTAFKWTDGKWPGVELKGQITYEFHVGTFTPEGTWRAAADKLPLLLEDGITLLEMMPVADFPGTFGWGYDGVNLFAPCRLYGTPDDLRFFVNRAHSLGLSVILDVVYNHFGPDGNYLGMYSDNYLHKGKGNEWGDAINFDGKNSEPVREFFITNGRYWIAEFHFDGFRFDATQSIFDKSDEYIIGAIGRAARAAAGKRSIVLVAENELQQTKLIKPRSEGGDDLDGVWNDDWHHSALVAVTGRNEAYYSDHLGNPQEFISAAKYGYLFQGQPYWWQDAARGMPAIGAPPHAFVTFIENHDQVSNSAFGDRVRFLTSPGRYRALTALLLLGPWSPLLFQGEEFGASTPFTFFSDVGDDNLREAIRKGRFEFLTQFPSIATDEMQKQLPVPGDPATFQSCKLRWAEREKNRQLHELHRDLIRLRRGDVRFREQIPGGVDGAVLGSTSFVLRFFGDKPGDERLLIVNFGEQQLLVPSPEPLLAPPHMHEWQTLWTSESLPYGGPGTQSVVTETEWTLPSEAAIALHPRRISAPRRKPRVRPR